MIKWISNQMALSILSILSIRPSNPRSLAHYLGVTEQTVVRKLKQLEKLGLVESRWERVNGVNVKIYRLKHNRIILDLDNGEIKVTVGDFSQVVHADVYTSPLPPSNFLGRAKELKVLDRCGRCYVYGMPGIGKTALVSRYVSNRDHIWFNAKRGIDLGLVKSMATGREIIVVDRAEGLDHDTLNTLQKLPNGKVVVISRVMHRGLHGYDVLRLGRMRELGKGFGHPGIVFGHMTPRDVVEESNLAQAELRLLMLLSALGARIRLSWISGELRGAQYLLHSLWRRALVHKSGDYYIVDPVVRRGIEVNHFMINQMLAKLHDIKDLAFPLVQYYVKNSNYDAAERILQKWINEGNIRLFFEDAHGVVLTLGNAPKSEVFQAALAMSYASLQDIDSARKALSSVSHIPEQVKNFVEYMARNYSSFIVGSNARNVVNRVIEGMVCGDLYTVGKLAEDFNTSLAEKIFATYLLGLMYLERGQLEFAESVILRAYTEALRERLTRLAALSLSALALIKMYKNLDNEAILLSAKAVAMARDGGLRYELLINHAKILQGAGRLAEAKELLTEALAFYEKTGNMYMRLQAILLYSDVLHAMSLLEEAIRHCGKALSEAERLGMEELIVGASSRLAYLHAWKRDMKNVKYHARRVSKICRTGKYPRDLALAYRGLAIALCLDGKLLDCNYFFNKALKILYMVADTRHVAYTLLDHAEVLKTVGDINGPKELYKRVAKIFENISLKEQAEKVYQKLGQL